MGIAIDVRCHLEVRSLLPRGPTPISPIRTLPRYRVHIRYSLCWRGGFRTLKAAVISTNHSRTNRYIAFLPRISCTSEGKQSRDPYHLPECRATFAPTTVAAASASSPKPPSTMRESYRSLPSSFRLGHARGLKA